MSEVQHNTYHGNIVNSMTVLDMGCVTVTISDISVVVSFQRMPFFHVMKLRGINYIEV